MIRMILALLAVLFQAAAYGLEFLHFNQVGAVTVKSLAEVVRKWLDVTPGRASYYEQGASNAGAEWEKEASLAKAAFKAAVTAGNIGEMFAGGIKNAGAEKYNRKVKAVGVPRFSQGVQAAGPDFQKGVEPMLATIAGLTLSARAPRGSESNLARVREIAVALNRKRMALRAAGA